MWFALRPERASISMAKGERAVLKEGLGLGRFGVGVSSYLDLALRLCLLLLRPGGAGGEWAEGHGVL